MPRHRNRFLRPRWLSILGVVGFMALLFWVWRTVPMDRWRGWVETLPAAPLLSALAVLPIFGFPVSALHLATGARFGFGVGVLAVAGSTAVHLLASFGLARKVDRPMRRLLARFGWRLPPVPRTAAWPFTTWVVLLPGVSYAVKNYVPPLGGVPLRIYLLVEFPLHVAQALVGLALGHVAIHFSWWLASAAVLYGAALVALSYWLARRFRAATAERAGAQAVAITSDEDPPPGEDDPT